MSTFPGFSSGDIVTAQSLNDMQISAIVATASQSMSNSTTFVSDNTLSVPVLANAQYFIEFFMIFEQSSTGAANMKTVWGVPSGAQGLKQVVGSTTSANFTNKDNTNARVAGHLLGTTVPYNMNAAAGAPQVCLEKAVVSVSGVSGSVVIQWAQNTAVAQSLIRDANSFVRYTRIA